MSRPMTPEELKRIEERANKYAKWCGEDTPVDYFAKVEQAERDRDRLLTEVKRLRWVEAASAILQLQSGADKNLIKQLADENERLQKTLDAANICCGCTYVGTVGCHCARAPWRNPKGE